MDLKKFLIETNGIRLHAVMAGPKDGRPVILLHGFPEFYYGWRKQIPALAGAGFRVIAPDQRGYNLSDKPKGIRNYRIDVLAADIIGLMDTLGYEKTDLVGHDWGAVVAWHLAAEHPERIRRLVNLNAPHLSVMVDILRHSLTQLRRSWYVFFFNLPWLPEWILRRDNFRLLGNLLRSSSRRSSFSDEDLQRYKEAWSQPGALTAMLNWYRSGMRGGLGKIFHTSEKPHIEEPALLLWGALDGALGRELAQPSIDLCDEGKLVFFEHATHWLQHDEADSVTELLLEFLGPA